MNTCAANCYNVELNARQDGECDEPERLERTARSEIDANLTGRGLDDTCSNRGQSQSLGCFVAMTATQGKVEVVCRARRVRLEVGPDFDDFDRRKDITGLFAMSWD